MKNLEDEHTKILAFLAQFEQTLLTFMDTNTFCEKDYIDAIAFVRLFADQRHHQREEQILFRYMIDHAGVAAEKLVRHGMLIEHDQARFFIKELENAVHQYQSNKNMQDKLTILAYGKAYCDLLHRHIEKENTVVYPFAKRALSKELFLQIEQEDQAYQAMLDTTSF